MATATDKPEKKENAFLSLALNVALPSIILTQLSKPDRLGPFWALIIAIALPLGYGIYDAIDRKKLNLFSVIGFVSILITGGLGLFPTKPLWFAIKEGAIAVIFGLAVLLTQNTKRPLVRQLLWNPEIFDTKRVEAKLETDGHTPAFKKLLGRSALIIALGLISSGVVNFFISMHLLDGTIGGTPEYIAAVGKQTALTWIVISIPLMIVMGLTLWYLFRGITKLSGMSFDDILEGEGKKTVVTKSE